MKIFFARTGLFAEVNHDGQRTTLPYFTDLSIAPTELLNVDTDGKYPHDTLSSECSAVPMGAWRAALTRFVQYTNHSAQPRLKGLLWDNPLSSNEALCILKSLVEYFLPVGVLEVELATAMESVLNVSPDDPQSWRTVSAFLELVVVQGTKVPAVLGALFKTHPGVVKNYALELSRLPGARDLVVACLIQANDALLRDNERLQQELEDAIVARERLFTVLYDVRQLVAPSTLSSGSPQSPPDHAYSPHMVRDLPEVVYPRSPILDDQ